MLDFRFRHTSYAAMHVPPTFSPAGQHAAPSTAATASAKVHVLASFQVHMCCDMCMLPAAEPYSQLCCALCTSCTAANALQNLFILHTVKTETIAASSRYPAAHGVLTVDVNAVRCSLIQRLVLAVSLVVEGVIVPHILQ